MSVCGSGVNRYAGVNLDNPATAFNCNFRYHSMLSYAEPALPAPGLRLAPGLHFLAPRPERRLPERTVALLDHLVGGISQIVAIPGGQEGQDLIWSVSQFPATN